MAKFVEICQKECILLDWYMCGIIITQIEKKGNAAELPRVGKDFDLHIGFLASLDT